MLELPAHSAAVSPSTIQPWSHSLQGERSRSSACRAWRGPSTSWYSAHDDRGFIAARAVTTRHPPHDGPTEIFVHRCLEPREKMTKAVSGGRSRRPRQGRHRKEPRVPIRGENPASVPNPGRGGQRRQRPWPAGPDVLSTPGGGVLTPTCQTPGWHPGLLSRVAPPELPNQVHRFGTYPRLALRFFPGFSGHFGLTCSQSGAATFWLETHCCTGERNPRHEQGPREQGAGALPG